MHVLLNVESLRPPLTGIGRYTANIVLGLLERPGIESVSAFAGPRPVDARAVLQAALAGNGAALAASGSAARAAPARPPRGGLRAIARAIPGAYRLRTLMAEQGLRSYLRRMRHAVYHEPNFILRPYPGPCVATVHDLSFVHYPQFHPRERVRHMMRSLPATLQRADRIVTDCEFVREEIVATFGVPRERIHAIPLGVAPAFRPHAPAALRAPLAQLGLEPGGYLLSVATFEPRKNLAGLVRAFMRLPAALRRHRPLALVGAPGWHGGELDRMLQAAERDGSVRRIGWVDDARLPLVYAGAALFAFPSIYEGFGLPLLEAMACGVPVVSSRTSSMPEIVGDAGLSVDPHDDAALAAALEQGLLDDAWRAQAVERGTRRAAGFTWAACVERTVGVYGLARGG